MRINHLIENVTLADFDTRLGRTAFLDAISSLVGISADQITILGIRNVVTKQLAAVTVEYDVIVDDTPHGEYVISVLSNETVVKQSVNNEFLASNQPLVASALSLTSSQVNQVVTYQDIKVEEDEGDDDDLSDGAIAGIVIACIIFCLCCCCCFFCMCKRDQEDKPTLGDVLAPSTVAQPRSPVRINRGDRGDSGIEMAPGQQEILATARTASRVGGEIPSPPSSPPSSPLPNMSVLGQQDIRSE